MIAAPCKNVLVFGATGTAGRAAAIALLQAGHAVTCFGRSEPNIDGVDARLGDIHRLDQQDMAGFDAVVSCLASRTGAPADAWKIDYQVQSNILKAAKAAGVKQFVLLSAICVQKPLLEFQRAKLAFEQELVASQLTYSIVRPTAFFKSLSGQIERIKRGKPFLLFGDGTLTACKPISDRDLGAFIASCLTDPDKVNRILPIGGPGPALTLRAQGEMLFELADLEPQFKSVPVWVMSVIVKGLEVGGIFNAQVKAKADLARTGRYYATESMLVWDGARYDAQATPSYGADTLKEHYAGVLSGEITVHRGDHAVF